MIALVSIAIVNGMVCANVHADEAEVPVTLTKEADRYIDCVQEEKDVPDTSDESPVNAAVFVLMTSVIIGTVAARTTFANHKNP